MPRDYTQCQKVDRNREIYRLWKVEKLTYKDIGKIFGLSATRVGKIVISEIRRKLEREAAEKAAAWQAGADPGGADQGEADPGGADPDGVNQGEKRQR
jgi:hypothetical protein